MPLCACVAASPMRAAALSRSLHSQLRSVSRLAPSVVSASSHGRRTSSSSFHSSARRLNSPQSPFKTFVDTLREEFRKSQELQDSYKQLQGEAGKIQDSEAMKRAREVYERARIISSIKENPKLRAAAEDLRKRGIKVGDAVSEALKGMEESDIMRGISRASSAVAAQIATSTEPLRQTAAYRALADTVSEALDDGSSSWSGGGVDETREARRSRREGRLRKIGKGRGIGLGAHGRIEENPDAGQALVVKPESAWEKSWNTFKSENPLMRRLGALREVYDESENPVISSLRSVTERIGSWFDENETAQVTRIIRTMDPSFNTETFQRELQEYIVPEVVDSYLSADRESLKLWCSEATYNVLMASVQPYLQQGLVSDSKILDIRHIEVVSGKLLENDVPVFVISFATQELLLFRNAISKEAVVGAEDRVESCRYAAVLTRVESEVANDVTGGWKVIDLARRSQQSFL